MFKIFKYLRWREWIQIILSIGFIVGQVWLDLKIPDYMSEVTKLVTTPGSSISEIWKTGGLMLACALGSCAMAVVCGFIAARVASAFSRRVRSEMFNKVEGFSMAEMKKFSISSLITRSTNDITQVQMVLAFGLQIIIKAPIMATWAIIKILGKDWQWSVATAAAVLVLLIMIFVVVVIALPKFKKMQKLTDNLNRVTRENLIGARVVRAYNAEKFEEKKFEEANQSLTKTNLFTNRVMAIMSPVMSLIMSGLSLAIYWIGASLINGAEFPQTQEIFSNMVVFSSYAMQVVMSFVMLTMIFIMLPRATVSARRINEVMDTKVSVVDGGLTDSEVSAVGEVEFKNVSFKYPDAEEYVLENISFIAKKGETVAFIGSTGSGKSTLINLVPRFYDATEGKVYIDGVNVKDYKLHDLYNKLGYVPQKAVLFSGTVESNVLYGEGSRAHDNQALTSALAISQSAFVAKMEQQEKSAITQGGTNVSGGQKQRLAIARAIARKPEILIFDDSFSALDYKTDKVLRKALNKDMKGVTSLIVAQRIGTIVDADKIIVLSEGKMVGQGKHKELLKTCEVYKEIALSQLSEEELNG